jgi:hypothetical protein
MLGCARIDERWRAAICGALIATKGPIVYMQSSGAT